MNGDSATVNTKAINTNFSKVAKEFLNDTVDNVKKEIFKSLEEDYEILNYDFDGKTEFLEALKIEMESDRRVSKTITLYLVYKVDSWKINLKKNYIRAFMGEV